MVGWCLSHWEDGKEQRCNAGVQGGWVGEGEELRYGCRALELRAEDLVCLCSEGREGPEVVGWEEGMGVVITVNLGHTLQI